MVSLYVLYWSSILIIIPLLLISMMAVGKNVADLQYQKAARLNGIRAIQSWMNVRIHCNRVLFAAALLLISTLSVFNFYDPYIERIALLIVVISFLVSAVLDWKADHKQLQILIKFSEVNNLSAVRLCLHSLSSQIGILYGFLEICSKTSGQEQEINNLQEAINANLQLIRHHIHEMDPSYTITKGDRSGNSST